MKSTPKYRPERTAALLKETIAVALMSQVKDPRVGFVTVTAVEVSRDVSVARVKISVLGDEDEKARALEGVKSASGFLRSLVARELKLRSVPELRFELDTGLEHAARVNEIFAELKRKDAKR